MTKIRSTFHVSRLVALPALILLFFHKMAFSNLILARGDTFLYFYPYWQAAADALRDGRIPFWNPDLFMGAPFLANSQVGFFYPLNWPVWWLLPTPYAVSASIIIHLVIAGWGAYLAGRRALSLSREAAWLTAVLFALGGYLTAQVEHVNQLQGLAWLPWMFVAVSGLGAGGWRLVLRRGTAVAILFSLQLLAGHTQTAFITGVGAIIFLAAGGRRQVAGSSASRFTFHVSRFVPLLIGAFWAFLITAVQLLPTLELAQHSSRQGGLAVNEVLSFSWHPLLLGRSLLPAYDQAFFTEYVAFLPLTGLVLALTGAWRWRERSAIRAIVLVTAVALVLALGRFTPVYWLLARLPGFNLFRVPARWLVLYGLGMALLAGAGWDVWRENWRAASGDWKRPLQWGLILIIFLIGWSCLSVPLFRFIPLGPEAPAAYPGWQTLLGWLLELGILAIVVRFSWPPSALSPLLLISLFLAGQTLPYNNLTTPEAYFDLRPPISRLQTDTGTPPGRMLSLSDIFFDPGDQGEVDAIYADQLTESARYDYTIAIKQKEIIAPNLPLAYGLPSIDGFDGGILPLSSYSDLTQFILPNNIKTSDGRLRELLLTGDKPAMPDPRWLDLFNVQYLITDKTGDVWRSVGSEQTIFFDLQHKVTIPAGKSGAVSYVPPFPATGLAIIGGPQAGTVRIETESEVWQITPQVVADDLLRVNWLGAAVVQAITFTAPAHNQWQIRGITLVNDDEQTFQSLVPGQYRLLHSGDVKIYENMDRLPRAFIAENWHWQRTSADSVAAMTVPAFNPRELVILTGEGQGKMTGAANGTATGGMAAITQYAPERVTIQTKNENAAVLILTDADYPGWTATIDGQAAAIYQADAFFRAVMLPAGQHEVVFSFESRSFVYGRLLSMAGLLLLSLAAMVIRRPARFVETSQV